MLSTNRLVSSLRSFGFAAALCAGALSTRAWAIDVAITNFVIGDGSAPPSVDVTMPGCSGPVVLGKCEIDGGCAFGGALLLPSECTASPGHTAVFTPGQVCGGAVPRGACCLGDGGCRRLETPESCATRSGTYLGDFSDCTIPSATPDPVCGGCVPSFRFEVYRDVDDDGVLNDVIDQLLFQLQPGSSSADDFIKPITTGTVALPGIRRKLDAFLPNDRLQDGTPLLIRAVLADDVAANNVAPQARVNVEISLVAIDQNTSDGEISVSYAIKSPAKTRPVNLDFFFRDDITPAFSIPVPDDLLTPASTAVPHELLLPSVRSFLDALGDGGRITNGEQLRFRVNGLGSAIDPASTVSLAQPAQVQVQLLAPTFGAAIHSLQYRVFSIARVNSFSPILTLASSPVRAAAIQVGSIPFLGGGPADAFLPGGVRSVELDGAVVRAQLNALPNGSRVRNSDVVRYSIPPGRGYPTVTSSDASASVRVDLSSFNYQSVTNEPDDRQVRISYTITAPAAIDSFGVGLFRGASRLGGLPGLTNPTDFQIGAHNNVALSSAQFASLLNALPNGNRIRDGELLTAQLELTTPPDAASVLTASRAADVTVTVTAFDFDPLGAGGDSHFSYTVAAPASIDTFTVDLYRDRTDTADVGIFTLGDERLCSAVSFVDPTPGAPDPDHLLHPGAYTNIVLSGFRACLDGLADAIRVRNQNKLFAVVRSVNDPTAGTNASQNACVNIRLTAMAATPVASPGATNLDASLGFTIDAPARIQRFTGRIGKDSNVGNPGIDLPGDVLAEAVVDGDNLLPATPHNVAFALFPFPAGVQNYVGTLDLDAFGAGVVSESLCPAATDGNVIDNVRTMEIRSKVDLTSVEIIPGPGGGMNARIKYNVSNGQAAQLAIQLLLDSGGVQTQIGDLQAVTASADLQQGVNKEITRPLPSPWGGGIQNADKVVAVLRNRDGSAYTQSDSDSRTAASDPISVNITDVTLALQPRADGATVGYRIDARTSAGALIGDIPIRPFNVDLVRQGATVALVSQDVGTRDVLTSGIHSVGIPQFVKELVAQGAQPGDCASGGGGAAIIARANTVAGGPLESNTTDNRSSASTGFAYPVDLRMLQDANSFTFTFTDDERKPTPQIVRGQNFGVKFQFDVSGNDLNASFGVSVVAADNEVGLLSATPLGQSGLRLRRIKDASGTILSSPQDIPIGADDRLGSPSQPLREGTYELSFVVAAFNSPNPLKPEFVVRVELDSPTPGVICETNEDNNSRVVPSTGTGSIDPDVDTDGDGLTDAEEINGFYVSRYTRAGEAAPIRDSDRITDEHNYGTIACANVGTLSNGLVRWQCLVKTDPKSRDSDGDGIDDFSEIVTYALGAESNGFVKGAGQSGVDDLPGSDGVRRTSLIRTRGDRIALGKPTAGVRTDPTRKDTDEDGVPDNDPTNPNNVDPAPQFKPSLFLALGAPGTAHDTAAKLDADLELQALLLNFDQDGDGFLEAPDANGDGVPDITRYNELTLEGLFGIDFSNDGTLRDGFDIGGPTASTDEDFVDDEYLALLGFDGDKIGPVDDPAARQLASVAAVNRALLSPRFGHFRVGSIQSFDAGNARFRPTVTVGVALVPRANAAAAPGLPTPLRFAFLPSDNAARATTINRRGNGQIDVGESYLIGSSTSPVNIATFPVDNCPGDASDTANDNNARVRYNPDQSDIDDDGIGDTCDPDADNDGVPNGFERVSAGCGAPCGAGVLPMMPLILLSLASGKWWLRRQPRSRDGRSA